MVSLNVQKNFTRMQSLLCSFPALALPFGTTIAFVEDYRREFIFHPQLFNGSFLLRVIKDTHVAIAHVIKTVEFREFVQYLHFYIAVTPSPLLLNSRELSISKFLKFRISMKLMNFALGTSTKTRILSSST